MHHCQEGGHQVAITWLPIESPEGMMVILLLFLTGLAASFTHCIGMCGPIAIAQMSMRLMALPASQMTQLNKFQCILSAPYYIGKAITYTILLICTYAITYSVRDNIFFNKIGGIFLLLMAILFILMGINRSVAFFSIKWLSLNKLDSIINKVKSKFVEKSNSYGIVMGMVLGLIPCGVVYAAIATIISRADNIIIASLSMFAFGIATIPGLFIVSWLGQNILSRSKKFFNLFYMLMMFFNAYLLIVASLNLL